MTGCSGVLARSYRAVSRDGRHDLLEHKQTASTPGASREGGRTRPHHHLGDKGAADFYPVLPSEPKSSEKGGAKGKGLTLIKDLGKNQPYSDPDEGDGHDDDAERMHTRTIHVMIRRKEAH